MTTMNNTMTTTEKTNYINMRCTLVNGNRWNFLMDISPLTEAEVAPVINYLVNGNMDGLIITNEVCEFIRNVNECAAEMMTRFCFRDNKFNHPYALSLIVDAMKVGLCCVDCCYQEVVNVNELNQKHLAGDKTALAQIATILREFFMETQPFVFDVI